jgi:hypothetical protein
MRIKSTPLKPLISISRINPSFPCQQHPAAPPEKGKEIMFAFFNLLRPDMFKRSLRCRNRRKETYHLQVGGWLVNDQCQHHGSRISLIIIVMIVVIIVIIITIVIITIVIIIVMVVVPLFLLRTSPCHPPQKRRSAYALAAGSSAP